LKGTVDALRAAFLLCGARNVVALRASRPVVLEPLKSWIEGLAE
jgi:isopentenyl diphosphate isomerase/L-lactate dehydrogenase-like FMN-dependent dehydrogenase